MKMLHINFMNNLQNHEFAELYDQLCENIEAEQLDDLQVKKTWRAAEKHINDIKYLRNDPRGHELTSVIQKKILKRTEYLVSVRMIVDGLKLSFCDEERAAAKVLSLWLWQQGKDMYTPSITSQSHHVNNLMHVLQLNAKIGEAITFLNFDRRIAVIFAINEEIDLNFMQRNKEMSARTKKSKLLRKAAYHDLKIFVSSINLYLETEKNNKEDTMLKQHSQLINKILTQYRSKLKSRTTKRKNKKEIAASVNELMNSKPESIQQEKEIVNLPLVIYNQLKSDPSTSSGTDEVKMNAKNVESDVKSNSGDATINKRKEDEGGDGKLPPVNRN